MSGPRDATEHEAGLYESAIANRDANRLWNLMQGYPNVLWGEATKKLSADDAKWMNETLSKELPPQRAHSTGPSTDPNYPQTGRCGWL